MKKIVVFFVMMVLGCAGVLGQKYYNPTFNNGFQWELEGGPCSSLSVSYKFAKRFSIGAGYQYGICVNGFLNKTKRSVTIQRNYSSTYNKDKSPSTIHRSDDWLDGMNGPTDSKFQKYFVNFQIRPVNRVFSPILGINVGQMTIHLDDYWYPYYGDEQSMLTLTPYAGMSIRLGRNSFLGLKFGVDNLGSKIAPTGDQQVDKRTIYDHGTPNYYVETTITDFPDVDISNIYLVLNFTHTMNFGHGYTEKRRIAEYRASHPKVKKERNGHVLDAIANVLEVTNNALGETAKTLNQMQGNNNVAVPNGNYNQNYNSGSYSGNNYNYDNGDVHERAEAAIQHMHQMENDFNQQVAEQARERELKRYRGADKYAAKFVPEKYDSKHTYADRVEYETKEANGVKKVTKVFNGCSTCKGTGLCNSCAGYTNVFSRAYGFYKFCEPCMGTGRCKTCDGRGYEIITFVFRPDGSWASYPHSRIYEGPHEDFEFEQEASERARNGGMTDESKMKAEQRQLDHQHNLCETKAEHYKTCETLLSNMKYSSFSLYDDARRRELQAKMRELRSECPDRILKSDWEDWNGN